MIFRRYIPVIIITGLVIVVQLLLSLSGTLYYMTQLTMSAYYSLVVIGICLLMGYALENLLKGILMADHPEYFKSNAKITNISSHNLVSLCKRCSLQIMANEEDLLKKLTDHILWVGKYPVPLEMSGMYPMRKADGTWDGPGDKMNGQATKELIENLYARFWKELSHRENTE